MVAGVKIHQAAREGKLVPEGWILDGSGTATTNPVAFESGGAHVPIGGHKGFGIALLVEILAGVMTGSGVTQEVLSFVAHPEHASHVGHFFVAIDVSSIEPIDDFKARIDKWIREVKSAPQAQGIDRIYLPGEMEWEHEKEAKAKGVNLDETTLSSLKLLSREIGLEADGFWNE